MGVVAAKLICIGSRKEGALWRWLHLILAFMLFFSDWWCICSTSSLDSSWGITGLHWTWWGLWRKRDFATSWGFLLLWDHWVKLSIFWIFKTQARTKEWKKKYQKLRMPMLLNILWDNVYGNIWNNLCNDEIVVFIYYHHLLLILVKGLELEHLDSNLSSDTYYPCDIK